MIFYSRYGLLDKSGKITVPAIYENISAIGNDLFSCEITGDGYYITINGKGEVIQ
ncbi:WG repeat-containing protein [Dysgonomonas sp. GY75]|nr:WG repeat-containing protein [Dysgonomonas sp. GY75]